MRRFASWSFLVFAIVSLCASYNLQAMAKDSRSRGPDEMGIAVYKLIDLPVFTAKGELELGMMMRLIRTATSPLDWKEHGGESTYTVYPDNLCVVITTQRRNHDKIGKLLNEFRSEPTTD